MTNRHQLFAALLSALGLAASLSMPNVSADFTTIPPDPLVVTKELERLPIGLAKAIEIAQQDVGGLAISARLDREAEPAVIAVEVYSSTCLSRVHVDAHSGKIAARQDIPRFAGEPVSGNWTELPSGLKYYELRVGQGASPVSPKNPTTLIYTGWLVDGTKFDSTVDHGPPMVIGLNKLVKGLEEGVMGMKVGGKRKLILPYDLAYGMGGKPPQIPPKATLIFDVELVALP